jgi:hypothetical protein
MDSYDYEETLHLYGVAVEVSKRCEEFIRFVEDNRLSSFPAPVGVISVQVNSILEGDRFKGVMGALKDAVNQRTGVTLSREGLDKVYRLEKLIADADQVSGLSGGRKGRSLGSSVSLGQFDISGWTPVILVSIAGIVGIFAIFALSKSRK